MKMKCTVVGQEVVCVCSFGCVAGAQGEDDISEA